ncbi:hypothetical protein GOV07_04310, partial [Candidatus Woesearchaeota archaeon]|nr:hypothetical protein [Candidatus Woesearchaeota archaeon]
GYVGIGTASPSATLHIIDTTEQLRVGYDAADYMSATSDSKGGLLFDFYGEAPTVDFRSDTDGTVFFQIMNSSDGVVFNVDTTNERVGIGTIAPADDLEVASATTAGILVDGGGSALLKLNKNAASDQVWTRYQIGGTTYWQEGLDANDADYAIQDASGNEYLTIQDTGSLGEVGINNANPGAYLDIYTNSLSGNPKHLILSNGTTDWFFAIAGCDGCYAPNSLARDLIVRGSGGIAFTTDGGTSTAMYIDSDGNVSGRPIYFACGENAALDASTAEWSCGGNGEEGQAMYLWDDVTATGIALACTTGTGTAVVEIQDDGVGTTCEVTSTGTQDSTTCDVDFDSGSWVRPYTVSDTGHSNCVVTMKFETR